MPTLLIKLEAPMQSWGTRSRFDERDTELEPSKSGVIGLVAAALGRPRDASVADLAAMRFGVRVDRAGTLAHDFHTAQDVLKANRSGRQETAVSRRFYLADASFTAGLEHDDRALLDSLHAALAAPHWPLYLGRRAFPPAVPLVRSLDESLLDLPLEDALRQLTADEAGDDARAKRYPRRRVLWIETAEPTGHQRLDQPTDDFRSRGYAPRHVRMEIFDVPVETDT